MHSLWLPRRRVPLTSVDFLTPDSRGAGSAGRQRGPPHRPHAGLRPDVRPCTGSVGQRNAPCVMHPIGLRCALAVDRAGALYACWLLSPVQSRVYIASRTSSARCTCTHAPGCHVCAHMQGLLSGALMRAGKSHAQGPQPVRHGLPGRRQPHAALVHRHRRPRARDGAHAHRRQHAAGCRRPGRRKLTPGSRF